MTGPAAPPDARREAPKILILTPVKNAARHLGAYWAGLERLTYPADRLSLGLLESDSRDDTASQIEAKLPTLRARYAEVGFWRMDFGFQPHEAVPRWEYSLQLIRRKILARSRNHLLFHALDDQDWVLWLDVDVISYPSDLIERLLEVERDIVHPHCIRRDGSTFDLNAWRRKGTQTMADLAGGPDLARLDSVGGTVLLIRADLHRDGLIFPPFPYGGGNPAIRRPHPLGAQVMGELETEGLGIMALDMGAQPWGLPNFKVVHADD